MEKGGDTSKEEDMGLKARHIPEEIVVNILPNLPIDSLQRFRCVSKRWCSWISLTKTHRRKFITKSGSDGTYYDEYDESRYGSELIQSIDQTTGRLEEIKDMPWKAHYVKLYGSCNGLILIGYGTDLFLWNPLLGRHKKLFSYSQISNDGFRIVGGLCFDSVNNEYKIVMALSHSSPDWGGQYVSVGSPRNKTWTHIKFPYYIGSVHTGPVLNNRLHWIVSDCNKRPFCAATVVVYFDTKIDEFVKLPMPLSREGEVDVIGGLGVLDGCLCLTRSENYSGNTVEVLGMKEYGVKESWSTLFRINGVNFSGGIVPLFYIGNQRNNVLVMVTKGRDDFLIIYDSCADLYNDFTSVKYMFSGMVYEETLVRPIGYGWEELDGGGQASYVEIWPNYIRTLERDERGWWSKVKEEILEDSETYSQDYKEYDSEAEFDQNMECYEDYDCVADSIGGNLKKKVKTRNCRRRR